MTDTFDPPTNFTVNELNLSHVVKLLDCFDIYMCIQYISSLFDPDSNNMILKMSLDYDIFKVNLSYITKLLSCDNVYT